MTVTIELAAVISLGVFTFFSLVDGVYFYLLRERLHEKMSSRLEHGLHSARGAVFVGLLYSWFASRDAVSFWVGVSLIVLDQALEVVDMAIERRSRSYSRALRSDE